MTTPFNYQNPTSGVPVAGSVGTGGEAVQTVEIASVAGGVTTRMQMGHQPMAGSLPVTLASDQPAIPVTQTTSIPAGTNAIGHVTVDAVSGNVAGTNAAASQADGHSATLGTTTDAATAPTVIGRLKALIALLPAVLGRTTMAGSLSVAIASDQAAVPVSAAALPLPAGAATAALQGAGLPVAFGAGGGVKIDGSGTALPVNGNIGGVSKAIVLTPTISAAAYAAGQLIGAAGAGSALANAVRTAGTGVIQSLVLSDKAKQGAAIDVVFFSAAPSAEADKTTFAPTAADLITIIGHVSIAATDYSAFSANSVATKPGLGLLFSVPSGTSIYAVLVSRGTPTYVSTSDLQLTVSILQD